MDLHLDSVLRANEAYRRGGLRPEPLAPRPSRGLVILSGVDARLDLRIVVDPGPAEDGASEVVHDDQK